MFDTLDPPPGGLVGLRVRLRRDASRRARRRHVAAVVAVAVLGVIVAWGSFAPQPQQALAPEFDHIRMRLGLLAPPADPVTIPPARRGDTAARRVPLPTDDIVFYLVASVRE